MATEHCKDCRHYHDNGSILGLCRRYPSYQNRSPNETCGEFSVKAVAELTPTSVGDFLPDPVKKRMGRPRKEAQEVADGN
jgi:hypothetical protein